MLHCRLLLLLNDPHELMVGYATRLRLHCSQVLL